MDWKEAGRGWGARATEWVGGRYCSSSAGQLYPLQAARMCRSPGESQRPLDHRRVYLCIVYVWTYRLKQALRKDRRSASSRSAVEGSRRRA